MVYVLEQCAIPNQLTHIPRRNLHSPTGRDGQTRVVGLEGWRGQWNLWVISNATHPTDRQEQQIPDSLPGSGPLSPDRKRQLGWDYMPDCAHIWRQEGPFSDRAVRYFSAVRPEFPRGGLRNLPLRRDELIRGSEGLSPALCAFQEDEYHGLLGQVEFTNASRAYPSTSMAVW